MQYIDQAKEYIDKLAVYLPVESLNDNKVVMGLVRAYDSVSFDSSDEEDLVQYARSKGANREATFGGQPRGHQEVGSSSKASQHVAEAVVEKRPLKKQSPPPKPPPPKPSIGSSTPGPNETGGFDASKKRVVIFRWSQDSKKALTRGGNCNFRSLSNVEDDASAVSSSSDPSYAAALISTQDNDEIFVELEKSRRHSDANATPIGDHSNQGEASSPLPVCSPIPCRGLCFPIPCCGADPLLCFHIT